MTTRRRKTKTRRKAKRHVKKLDKMIHNILMSKYGSRLHAGYKRAFKRLKAIAS